MSSFATVLHLETGHVLAAVSSGSLEPTVEQLTGGKHLAVRYFGPDALVEVPDELLTATRVLADDDVLDRPPYYVVSDATPPLSLGVGPTELASGDSVPAGDPGADAVVVWQTPDGPQFSRVQLAADGSFPTAEEPPGASYRLIAWKDGPLILDAV